MVRKVSLQYKILDSQQGIYKNRRATGGIPKICFSALSTLTTTLPSTAAESKFSDKEVYAIFRDKRQKVLSPFSQYKHELNVLVRIFVITASWSKLFWLEVTKPN